MTDPLRMVQRPSASMSSSERDALVTLCTAAYEEAVATLPSMQRRGYARALMRAVPPLLTEHAIALLSPSEEAFYARFGWARWPGPLSYRDGGSVIETPEEEVMNLRLPQTPADLDDRAAIACDWRPGEVW